MAFDSPFFVNAAEVLTRYAKTRSNSERLADPLSAEDWMLQSMPDASPIKWNLAHTSWFFETFILRPYLEGYSPFHPRFGYLFNSYYNQIGKMHPRPDRGLLSRPSADEIRAYRQYVDKSMITLVEQASDGVAAKIAPLIATGLAHEEQHQELLLTDIKHGLFQNPLAPAAYDPRPDDGPAAIADMQWVEMEGGLCEIGFAGDGFAFDNEGPRHKVYLHPFQLANRPVTNGEFQEFIDDGGYREPSYWFSDAWDLVQSEGWSAPLYWREGAGDRMRFTLFGDRAIDPHTPVCHLSYYEAAAYAAWCGARLPTEFEWEAAASLFELRGNVLQDGVFVGEKRASGDDRLLQLFGDVWEWTASPYVAYPGYAPPAGAIGEYNGKFMSGQMVLRGGSCATPAGHLRLSYRNFFPPQARWQFSGLRLARDC
ncbi:MAG: ergothioneine biosynthesis protein EgtB [Pseudomonadota bacterium]